MDSEIASNRLEDGNKQIILPESQEATEAKLEAFCESVGLGYPNEIEC